MVLGIVRHCKPETRKISKYTQGKGGGLSQHSSRTWVGMGYSPGSVPEFLFLNAGKLQWKQRQALLCSVLELGHLQGN